MRLINIDFLLILVELSTSIIRTSFISKADGDVHKRAANIMPSMIFLARRTEHQLRLFNGYVIATQRSTVNVTVSQTLVLDEKSAIGRHIVIRIADNEVL